MKGDEQGGSSFERSSEPPGRNNSGRADNASFLTVAPTINLLKGGVQSGIGEKFAANPVAGTGCMTAPIATSPGRSGSGRSGIGRREESYDAF